MLKELLSFIKDKFDLMPKWAQVATYLLIVGIFAHLMLAPRFIDLTLIERRNGDEYPLANSTVTAEISGRLITILTGAKGQFSVPIGIANPIGGYSFVLQPEDDSDRTLDVDVGGHWAYRRRAKLVYFKNTDEYKVISRQASALTGVLPKARAADQEPSEGGGATEAAIAREVYSALAKATGFPADGIQPGTPLRSGLGANNSDLSYVNHLITRRFNIEIIEPVLRYARTAGDVAQIATAAYAGEELQPAVAVPEQQVIQIDNKWVPMSTATDAGNERLQAANRQVGELRDQLANQRREADINARRAEARVAGLNDQLAEAREANRSCQRERDLYQRRLSSVADTLERCQTALRKEQSMADCSIREPEVYIDYALLLDRYRKKSEALKVITEGRRCYPENRRMREAYDIINRPRLQ